MTLHATCNMPSPLEICFSAQQLRFATEYRELCAATESLPHEKYYGSHDWHTIPRYQFGGLWFSLRIVSQQGLWNLWGVERPLIFSWESKSMWNMRNHQQKWEQTSLFWLMYVKKDPWGHYGSYLKVWNLVETFLCLIYLEGVFREHIPHILPWRNGCLVDHQLTCSC